MSFLAKCSFTLQKRMLNIQYALVKKSLLETKVDQKYLLIFAQQLKFKHPYFYLPIAGDNEKCIKEYKKEFLAVSRL